MKNIHKIRKELFITSDEEIKDNDYITDGYKVWQWKDDSSLLGRKKVILTTDQDLIKDGVQAIDDEFLEWFVKNPSCEEVEVQCRYNFYAGQDKIHYKIIIPKEELKQDLEKEMFELEQELDIPSHLRWYNSKPKQETFEEAADESLQDEIKYWYEKTGSLTSEDIVRRAYSLGITEGAKWQQEDMIEKLEMHILINEHDWNRNPQAQFRDFVEQVKKR